jgi:hypothetical protein
MKQVLSIEQMQHLQELGLDTSDASMYWARVSHGSSIDDKSKSKWFLSLHKEFQTCGFMSYESIPTYTLQDILDKLPCFIGKEVLTIQKLADSYTCLYIEPYTRSMINITESKEPIDAAYDMLCWCIENGYVKIGKEEQ